MTEKIRDYSVNGAMIIGVDNGYGNMKTARRCFKTALVKYDSEPVLSRDYLEYEGKFYVIGEGHKGFVADKQSDEDNYILTLAAVAKELEARGYKQADFYFETREKEDAFAERMVQMVEQKVLANLPSLAGMYQMQQSMLMAGLMGTGQGVGHIYSQPMNTVSTAPVKAEQPSTKSDSSEPEENEFLDYSFGV